MKSLERIGQPDERQQFFVGDLTDLHAELSAVTLDASVPENVRELFDTAKNICLYSWFVYEFHPMAELAGFLALEAALRARAARVSNTLAKKSLSKLMEHALSDGWIAEERIAGRLDIARGRVLNRKAVEAIERSKATGIDSVIEDPTDFEIAEEAQRMKIVEGICQAAVKLRNGLAHGERQLVPGSHRRLRTTADLINQLYVVP